MTAALSAVHRYQYLVQRRRVGAQCAGPLEDAGQAVQNCIKHMDAECTRVASRLADASTTGSEAAALCTRARSIVSKAEAVHRVLGSLPQLPSRIQSQLRSVRSRALAAAKQSAHLWSAAQEVSASEHDGRDVVSFDGTGNMAIGVSDSGLRATSSTRRMAELGVPIPDGAIASLTTMEARHRHLVALKKIGAFYNSLGSIIVPCTKPLLLQPLVDFEAAVSRASERHGGHGRDSQQLWGRVDDLQGCAERVATANRIIRTGHMEIARTVCKMFSCDLTNGREGFLDLHAKVRTTIARTLVDVGLLPSASIESSIGRTVPAAVAWL